MIRYDVAGCSSVQDDPAWGHRPLLTSQFAALFLANPHLQYVDMSNSGLTNNGIFFVLLEMSLCDPLLSPSGLKHLKQVIVGPPVGHTEQIKLDQGNNDVYVSSISEAIAELYFQSPALQLIALLLSAKMPATGTDSNVRSNHTLRDTWMQLNEDNHADVGTLPSKTRQVCLILRTRWAH